MQPKRLEPREIATRLSAVGRWREYIDGLCDSCYALCCHMPSEVSAEDLVRMGVLTEFHLELSERDRVKDALKHPGVGRFAAKSGKYTLAQRLDGACYFLDQNYRCSIYENRPDTCRNHPAVGPRSGYCAYIKKPEAVKPRGAKPG